HAARRTPGVMRGAAHAEAVAGGLGDGTGNMGTVERTGRDLALGGIVVPVAVVVGTGDALVGLAARQERVSNEVVALQHIAVEILGAGDVGGEHGDHHARAAVPYPCTRAAGGV